MTTLVTNKPRTYEGEGFNHLPVVAADIIYEGAAVGENGSGYARPLQAGDPFRGFAVDLVDNSDGGAGGKNVKVRERGLIELSVASVAIGDVGKAVYASDDDTFVLTQGSNSRIGYVRRFVSTGVCIVAFAAQGGKETLLTDNSTGTASDTIATISDAATKNAIASLTAKVNYLLRAQG